MTKTEIPPQSTYLDIIEYFNVKSDKKYNHYMVYSNFGYLATFFIILLYIRYIFKYKNYNSLNYINEILYLSIIEIYILLTMLNSMYYHNCGGTFKNDNTMCKYGFGYELKTASMNDLILASTTLIGILVLLPRKFGDIKIRFFLFILANISLIGVLSFRDIPFIYSNIIPFIIGFIVMYYCFKEIRGSNTKIRSLIILFTIATILSFAGLFCFFKATNNSKSITKLDLNWSDPNDIESKQKIKEKMNNTDKYHGSWHILGGLSGLFFILYKIEDIINLHSNYKALI